MIDWTGGKVPIDSVCCWEDGKYDKGIVEWSHWYWMDLVKDGNGELYFKGCSWMKVEEDCGKCVVNGCCFCWLDGVHTLELGCS